MRRTYVGLGSLAAGVLLVVTMVVVAGCGGSSGGGASGVVPGVAGLEADGRPTMVTPVTMTDMDSFSPVDISVLPGSVIVWTNRDTDPHTATADLDNPVPGGPNSGTDFPDGVGTGDSYLFRVPRGAKAGTVWFYHCCNHGQAGDGAAFGPGMSAVIRVVASLGAATNATMTASDTFSPVVLNVAAGTLITWTNADTDPHTATVDLDNPAPAGPNSEFNWPNGVPSGQTFSWRVPTGAAAGTKWYYHCCNHGKAGDGNVLGAGMSGVIVVTP